MRSDRPGPLQKAACKPSEIYPARCRSDLAFTHPSAFAFVWTPSEGSQIGTKTKGSPHRRDTQKHSSAPLRASDKSVARLKPSSVTLDSRWCRASRIYTVCYRSHISRYKVAVIFALRQSVVELGSKIRTCDMPM